MINMNIMNITTMFKKKHKLDTYPKSSAGYPLRQWGMSWYEYIGGKWKLARFESESKINYNKTLMGKVNEK